VVSSYLGLGRAREVAEAALEHLLALEGREVVLVVELLVVDLVEGGDLGEGDDQHDLGDAELGHGGQGLDGVQLGELGRELEAVEARGVLHQLGGHHAQRREHRHAPVLQLGGTQPAEFTTRRRERLPYGMSGSSAWPGTHQLTSKILDRPQGSKPKSPTRVPSPISGLLTQGSAVERVGSGRTYHWP
jgi:hypothetical protein